MEKINIDFKIMNKDLPYTYTGEATLNKDIIEFKDNDEEYIYDKKINRLTKIKNGYKIVLDFDQEVIRLNDNDSSLDMKIKIKKKNISNNSIKVIYSIDRNEITFELEVK